MTKFIGAWAFVFASTGMAQIGSYLGPGVMSNGAGTIGERSGAPVDLRFYADVSGVYDNGLQPFQLGPNGQLEAINGLYGEQLDYGVYGTHTWRNALLGLNFSGNFYDYNNATQYDGNTQNLMLGYTWQKSRRLIFDFREVGGLSSLGYPGSSYNQPSTVIVDQPTSTLFDSRYYYTQSTADMTYLLTARTSFTVGGDGFWVHRDGVGLASTQGYSLRGSLRHRLSKTQTIGINYDHIYYDFPPAFGASTTDIGTGFFATSLGKRWTLSIAAGAAYTNVSGVQQVSINPVIAALLGTSVGYQAFYRQDIYPSGTVSLAARLKNSALGFSGGQTIIPGNGVYLTSRQATASASYSYTGIKKWNFGISGTYNVLDSIGQGIPSYGMFGGGAGFTYGLSRMFHIVGRYDARHQEITYTNGFRNSSYRVSLGLAFSPGDVPLSLW